mgnify:CR=1 FL=1
MENIMMLPASYCVMNEEEMTYTTGGASAIQAIADRSPLCMLQASPLSVITARRTLILGLRMVWTISQMILGKSVSNFLYDLACASWVLGTSATGIGLVINAAIILL